MLEKKNEDPLFSVLAFGLFGYDDLGGLVKGGAGKIRRRCTVRT